MLVASTPLVIAAINDSVRYTKRRQPSTAVHWLPSTFMYYKLLAIYGNTGFQICINYFLSGIPLRCVC